MLCIKQRNKKLVTPLDHPGGRTEVNLLPSIRPIIRVTEGAGAHPRRDMPWTGHQFTDVHSESRLGVFGQLWRD